MIAPNLKSAVSAARKVASAVWRRETVLVSSKVLERRRAKCAKCPSNEGGQCVECTCFVRLKTLLKTEKCPLRKW